VASGSVGEISGGVAYVRTDFMENMLSLLSLLLELARFTTGKKWDVHIAYLESGEKSFRGKSDYSLCSKK